MAVLIVDDDADVREVMALLLSTSGFEPVTAACATEALDRLGQNARPSVILLDIRMAGMNGLELLGLLKRDPALAAIPVVVITGDVTATRASIEAGAVAILVKPLDATEVIAMVRRFEVPSGRSAA